MVEIFCSKRFSLYNLQYHYLNTLARTICVILRTEYVIIDAAHTLPRHASPHETFESPDSQLPKKRRIWDHINLYVRVGRVGGDMK